MKKLVLLLILVLVLLFNCTALKSGMSKKHHKIGANQNEHIWPVGQKIEC